VGLTQKIFFKIQKYPKCLGAFFGRFASIFGFVSINWWQVMRSIYISMGLFFDTFIGNFCSMAWRNGVYMMINWCIDCCFYIC
jgi:hypothetical protein